VRQIWPSILGPAKSREFYLLPVCVNDANNSWFIDGQRGSNREGYGEATEILMNPFHHNIIAARIIAMSCLALSAGGVAFSQEEVYPTEPPLADSGWTVRYNDLLLACYQGAVDACDRVASDRGMVFDTPIYNYAATCGGRLDIVTARRLSARMLANGIRGGRCSYAFSQQ
jgi:hypothetical protein